MSEELDNRRKKRRLVWRRTREVFAIIGLLGTLLGFYIFISGNSSLAEAIVHFFGATSATADSKDNNNTGESNNVTLLSNDAEITAKSESIVAKQDAYREEQLATAAGFMDSGEYEKAITALTKALSQLAGDAKLESKLSEYKNTYREYVSQQVDTLIGSKKYEDAIAFVKTSLQVLPQDSILSTLETELLDKYTPVSLCSLQYINIVDVKPWENPQDAAGTMYENGIRFYTDNSTSTIEYNIGGQYSKFRGAQVVVNNDHPANGYALRIYGDGKLLYKSNSLRYDNTPLTFEIDVTNVKILKIVASDDISPWGFFDAWGIVDLWLLKY